MERLAIQYRAPYKLDGQDALAENKGMAPPLQQVKKLGGLYLAAYVLVQ